MKTFSKIVLAIIAITTVSCGTTYKATTTFPPADEVFITSGDGDIQKPYTPVGQLIYYKTGYRIGLPLLGLIPINDVNPDKAIREEVVQEIKSRGGDGLINMSIHFEGPKNGALGFGARGGSIVIYGTIIKR